MKQKNFSYIFLSFISIFICALLHAQTPQNTNQSSRNDDAASHPALVPSIFDTTLKSTSNRSAKKQAGSNTTKTATIALMDKNQALKDSTSIQRKPNK